MTVFVIRGGKLVDRDAVLLEAGDDRRSPFPSPRVSRMASFESPVTGKEISSWRERERDMTAVGAVDPRDLPRKPFEKRKRDNERQRKLTPEWGGATST